MNDDLINLKPLTEENIDKIKVSSAEIVVHGTKENSYYEIKYFDLSDNKIHIGFSSYKLDIVFEFLEKYFDIVNKESKFECSEIHIEDLISRKAVISLIDELGYVNCKNHDDFKANSRIDKIRQSIIELPINSDKEKIKKTVSILKEHAENRKKQSYVGTPDFHYYNGMLNTLNVIEQKLQQIDENLKEMKDK